MSPAFVDNDGNFNWRKVGYHARSAFAVLLSLAVLAGGGYFLVSKAGEAWAAFRTVDDYEGEGVDKVSIVVPPGASATQIGDVLVEANVIKSTSEFRDEAAKNEKSQSIQPGRYDLLTELPAKTALEMMLNPENLKKNQVTIPEGYTVTQQWAGIQKELQDEEGIEVTEGQLKEAAVPGELGLPEWSRDQVEGFMFPETYEVTEPVIPQEILKKQAAQFVSVTDEIEFLAGAESLGMEPFDVLTVASIIEREVNQDGYRDVVARVILNRLEQGLPLQMDSTVHYALQDFSTATTTAADRDVDSLYNTYRNQGLPPGAISNPGRKALDAASHPADSDALYFVTVNLDTGETLFAATLEEHNVNVAVFQQWCQANEGRC